ncbi:MAG: AAA family ATPase [Saprospiraceae bacterium]
MISVYKDFDDVPKGLEDGDLTEAKKRLREIYHGKCAYTEQKITEEETYILRYRPVSEYPWLEFEWSNLLPVCKMVFEAYENFKKLQLVKNELNNEFPIRGEKVEKEPIDKNNFKADSELMLSEIPLLLHPEVDTIENYIRIFSEGNIYSISNEGITTIETFNLNNQNLIQKRLELIKLEQRQITEIFYDYKRRSDDAHMYLLQNSHFTLTPVFERWLNLSKDVSEFSFVYKIALKKEYDDLFIIEEINEQQEFLSYYINYFYQFIWNIPQRNESELYFSVKNFFQLKNLSIKNLDMSNQWIFLTGENGFGKTLILQAFYIAIFGTEKYQYPFTIDSNSRFEIKIPFINVQMRYSNIIGGVSYLYNQNSYVEKAINAYGANRLNISGYINEDEKTQTPQKVRKSDSLFKNDGTLYNIEAYLTKMHGREQYKNRIEIIKNILIDLLPSVAAIEIDDSEIDKKVYYRETAENGDLLNRIQFHQLSAGNKSIIAMIGDMLIEFYDGQPDVENSKDFVGIVLIDEIDAHLHPKWQRELVIKLSELFPKVQFIASTHSPIPLLGAPKETVIFNVEKPDRKTGIQVRRLDIDVSQLTPNTILSSPIFGFDDIIPKSRDKNKKSYTQDEYEEVTFEKKMDTVLRKLATMEGKTVEELINE